MLLAHVIDCARLTFLTTASWFAQLLDGRPCNETNDAALWRGNCHTHEESTTRMDFLLRLEQSGFATWVREGGTIWELPIDPLYAHARTRRRSPASTAGDRPPDSGLRQQLPLAPMKRLFPVMWMAFAVTAASGTALLIADATTKLASPVFYVKMVFVALGPRQPAAAEDARLRRTARRHTASRGECQAAGRHVAAPLGGGHHGRPPDGLPRAGQRPRLASEADPHES